MSKNTEQKQTKEKENDIHNSTLKRTKKPGKRIRLMVDSEDENDFVDAEPRKEDSEKRKQSKKKEEEIPSKEWFQLYTLEQIPETIFDFCINWQTSPQVYNFQFLTSAFLLFLSSTFLFGY